MADNTRVITCRTHGGTFRVPVKRGRPPVNCTPENKCRITLKPVPGSTRPEQIASQIKSRNLTAAGLASKTRALRQEDSKTYHRELAQTVTKPAQSVPERRTGKARALKPLVVTAELDRSDYPPELPAQRSNGKPLGVTKAFQAKAQLEALGWSASGNKAGDTTTVTAVRGTELLVITWDTTTGTLMSQDYNLWNVTVGKGRNGMPPHKLPFDPEEMSDADLVRELTGMKVTWWNTLAQGENSDVIQAGTIKIEHSYEANGDEVYGDRIVKFIGYGGGGFRAFRLAALMKVG